VIIDGLLNLLYAILEPLVSVLPTGNLPESGLGVWNGFAGLLASLDEFLPVAAPFRFFLNVVLVTLPAFLTFRIGVWIFDKIRGA